MLYKKDYEMSCTNRIVEPKGKVLLLQKRQQNVESKKIST